MSENRSYQQLQEAYQRTELSQLSIDPPVDRLSLSVDRYTNACRQLHISCRQTDNHNLSIGVSVYPLPTATKRL